MYGQAIVDTLIFDLGDVLFSWSATTTTSISPKTLKAILDTSIWHDYECDRVDQATCYERCAAKFEIPCSEIQAAFDQARASLAADNGLVELIRRVRAERPDLRVYAMSNISAPDYEYLRTERADVDWSIFDRVFTSADAGTRKPNLSFFEHVVKSIGGSASSMMFVDDRAENVMAARSCGLLGVVYNARTSSALEDLDQQICNCVLDPVIRGESYLRSNARDLKTLTEHNVEVRENFAQLLIYELSEDRTLITLKPPNTKRDAKWNYFQEHPMGTSDVFPCDLDTTSLGLTVIPPAPDVAHAVMDEMLQHLSDDRVILTYFDDARQRTDPVVCTNVLSLFYTYNRQDQLRPTLAWVTKVLQYRAYVHGTRYYCTAEAFLYFLHRLLQREPSLRQELGDLLLSRTMERVGRPADSIALAMRILVLAAFDQHHAVHTEVQQLRAKQEIDGGWEMSYIYCFGSSGLRIGNRGLATAFALSALQAARRMSQPKVTPTKDIIGLSPALNGVKPSGAMDKLSSSVPWLRHWQSIALLATVVASNAALVLFTT